MDNPFERYDLDPRDGIAAITARLKELAEDATDDAERERLRAAWEELTMHPRRRLRAAVFAHPETRPPLGSPPSPPRVRGRGDVDVPLGMRDLAARPSVLAVLAPRGAGEGAAEVDARVDDAPLALEDDPLL